MQDIERTLDILLIRHGETDLNNKGLVLGHSQVPLNDRGRAQARQLAAHLAQTEPRIQKLITSDLPRAAQTAAAIGEATNLPVQIDPAWRERGWGDMEEQPGERWDPAVLGVPPGGEQDAEFGGRVRQALTALLNAAGDLSTLAVVTHGGVLWELSRMMGSGALRMQADHPPVAPDVSPNCSITHLHGTRHADGWTWRLKCLNEAGFLG